MIAITSVGRHKLLNPTIVSLLVVIAVFAWIGAIQRIEEIKQEVRFTTQLTDGLDELIKATDAIHDSR